MSNQTEVSNPLVVVCIPARHSGAHLANSVRSLQQQDYPNFLVVYSLERGDPDTWLFQQVAANDERFYVIETHLVKRPGRNANELRNAAGKWVIDHYNGSAVHEVILVYTDMKITHPPKWISQGVHLRQQHQIEAVGGVMIGLIPNRETYWQRFWRLFTDLALITRNPRVPEPYVLTRENSGKSESLPITASLLLSLAYFLLMGGFNPRFRDSYEDYEAVLRLLKRGGRLFFTGEWQVFHLHRTSFRLIQLEYARSGRGAAQLFYTDPGDSFAQRRVKQVVGILFALVVAFFTFAILVISQAWAVLLGGIGLGLLLIIALGIANVRYAKRWEAIAFPVLSAFFILVFSVNFVRKLLEGGGETKSNQFIQMIF